MTAMNQLLGDEELQLRSAAAEMLRRESPVSAFRHLRDTAATPRFDTDLWAQMVEMGWSGMLVSEGYGGLEFGHRGVGLICEEMGRNLVASPFVSSCVHAVTVLKHASDSLKQALLPSIAAGDTTVALALSEDRRFAPLSTRLQAVREGQGYRISGVKQFVPDGSFADHLLVLAHCADAQGAGKPLGLFHVPVDLLSVGDRASLSLVDSRDYAHLELRDLLLPESALIGAYGGAEPILEELLDVAAAHSACELLGISDALLDMTVEYLKVREQFGALIGSFQALQHRAASMFTRVELLRSVVFDAVAALDADREDRASACSHARAMAIDVSKLVATEAIQMHGGMGVTDELDVGLFYKRTLTLRQQYGDRGFHRDRFARQGGY